VGFTFGMGQVVRFAFLFLDFLSLLDRRYIEPNRILLCSPHVHVFQGTYGGALSLLVCDTAEPSPQFSMFREKRLVPDLEGAALRTQRPFPQEGEVIDCTAGHRGHKDEPM
jgi:hypothetical protein